VLTWLQKEESKIAKEILHRAIEGTKATFTDEEIRDKQMELYKQVAKQILGGK
jgi:hypothetical protein